MEYELYHQIHENINEWPDLQTLISEFKTQNPATTESENDIENESEIEHDAILQQIENSRPKCSAISSLGKCDASLLCFPRASNDYVSRA